MTKYIAIFIGVMAILALGVFIFWPQVYVPTPPPDWVNNPGSSNTDTVTIPEPGQSTGGGVQTSPEVQQVKNTVEVVLNKNGNPDNKKLGATAVVEGWALQNWVGDQTGGEALLKYSTTTKTWAIVRSGGGAWSVEGLVYFGVPEDIATKLLSDLRKQ